MDDLQALIGAWGDRTFPRSSTDSIVHHLAEEVQELHYEIGPEETADCAMMLFHIAHKCGFSLEQAIREKFAINQKRRWSEPDSNGVSRHIKE